MVRWVGRLLLAATQHRIREAVVAILAGGMGVGYGATMMIAPNRHLVPTLADAIQWGGPMVWGMLLFVSGVVICASLPWHDAAAPAVPLGVFTILLGALARASIGAAFDDGVPAAAWVYVTLALLSLLLSLSYSLGLILQLREAAFQGPARLAASGA